MDLCRRIRRPRRRGRQWGGGGRTFGSEQGCTGLVHRRRESGTDSREARATLWRGLPGQLLLSVLKTLSFICSHPIGRRARGRSILRFVGWQIRSRLSSKPLTVPFVDDTVLVAKRGLHGITGNIYVGLHEFEDMAFVLHCLVPGDLFVDVGANVGAYSLLAASRRSHCIAFEPIPSTYCWFRKNIEANRFAALIDAREQGLARGSVASSRFARTSMPPITSSETREPGDASVEASVDCLDHAVAAQVPTILKIDTEGFEAEVLAAAHPGHCETIDCRQYCSS